MHLKYFNIALLLAFVVGSVWLFWTKAPNQGLTRTLCILARVSVAAVWLVVLSAFVYFAYFFSLTGDTKDEVLFQRESPNKLYDVAVMHRYGGAVVRNTTAVSVRTSGERLDTKKNSIIFTQDGALAVDATWDGDRHIIVHSDLSEVYYRATNWHDVNITYLPDERIR